MIGAWTINVSGRVYGPFTSERMRAFVGEGRLAPHSLVAREGTADWHEARDEPEFSDTFAQRTAQTIAEPADTNPAAVTPAPQQAPAPQATPAPQRRDCASGAGTRRQPALRPPNPPSRILR